MKFQILDDGKLQFYNSSGTLTGVIEISGSGDMLISPQSGSTKDVIIGNRDTAGDIEIGLASAAVDMTFLGGGTVTANGNTLTIGKTSDTVKIVNASYSQSLYITGSLDVTGSVYADNFIGNGSGLTDLQRPMTESGVNFTSSIDNAGYYFRTGGNVTCSIQTNASIAVPAGTEYDFFQTASAGNLLFESASSSITVNSKNGNLNLSGQFSSATLKKTGTNEWDLMGDLT